MHDLLTRMQPALDALTQIARRATGDPTADIELRINDEPGAMYYFTLYVHFGENKHCELNFKRHEVMEGRADAVVIENLIRKVVGNQAREG